MSITPIPPDLDLSVPSYRGAYHHARNAAYEAAAAAGRERPNADDARAADMLFLRLLYLVEGSEGGLLGLHDEACEEYLARLGKRFTFAMAVDALYQPATWPTHETTRKAA